MRCNSIVYLCVAIAWTLASTNPARSADQPASQTTAATVSPEAQAELNKIKEAYGKLSTLELGGKMRASIDASGRKDDKEAEFSSAFAAPNKFTQQIHDDVLAGSTGEKLYIYSPERKVYRMDDAPKGKVEAGKMPEPYREVIGKQNPSLMLALSADPKQELTGRFSDARKGDDQIIDGKKYTKLELSDPEANTTMTLLTDPQTHLLRRATVDMSKMLEQRGASDVKEATVVIDYTTVIANATVKSDQFAWAPPADARDSAAGAEPGEGDDPAKALAGRPAPDFKLKDLADKEVSLSESKGHVVVLDFWATWCGPCRQGLPHVDKVSQEFKDQGLLAYAVNLEESKEQVQKFMEEQKLKLTALLDSDGAVSKQYMVNGIPQTVVIGKDGVVKGVFVGYGPDSEKKLHDAVESAVKAGG
jgi:peroxiredoxin